MEGVVGADCQEPIFTGLIINLVGSNVGGDISGNNCSIKDVLLP